MNKSTRWQLEAKQLCDELGPEDGVDPRILAKQSLTKSDCHKSQRLSKEAKHALSLVLSGELSDPILNNLMVVDVIPDKSGQDFLVYLCQIDSHISTDEIEVLTKLQAVQGYLRSAIAYSVKRKKVPALKFQLVRTPDEVHSNACL